jgi:hypothetical protein
MLLVERAPECTLTRTTADVPQQTSSLKPPLTSSRLSAETATLKTSPVCPGGGPLAATRSQAQAGSLQHLPFAPPRHREQAQ